MIKLTNTLNLLHKNKAQVVLDLHESIVRKTPHDTGSAKINWRVSKGFAPTDTVKTDGLSLSRQQAESISMAAAKQAVSNGGSGPLFITNNLEYIPYLENGSSNQAPAGMIALSIEEIKAKNKI